MNVAVTSCSKANSQTTLKFSSQLACTEFSPAHSPAAFTPPATGGQSPRKGRRREEGCCMGMHTFRSCFHCYHVVIVTLKCSTSSGSKCILLKCSKSSLKIKVFPNLLLSIMHCARLVGPDSCDSAIFWLHVMIMHEAVLFKL